MLKIFTTSRFEKRLKIFIASHPDLANTVRKKMKEIAKNPFSSTLKTHKLTGYLNDCFGSKITFGSRIIFTMNNEELCFIDIGSHDQVY
jgi:mRNA-degrading endonuclease YafQ of YafQ-DinJ toxin-antitoxin module